MVVSRNGRIGPVRVLNGLRLGLTAQAIECVRQWVFVPAQLNGEPADVAEIEVGFEILDPRKK